MTKIDPYLTIVNKEHNFDESMLEQFNMIKVKDSDGPTYMEEKTYEALGNLSEFLAKKHGIKIGLTSAGRTVERQQQVLNEMIALNGEKAKQTTALPGQSEHHLGTALDVYPTSLKSKILTNITKPLPKDVRKDVVNPIRDDLYAKLHASLEQFGFILRYTKDKQEKTGYPAERWHIRFVGKENAKQMNASNMCLEEYVEFIKSNQNVMGE